jgi:pyridoxamine 5'-phosphate oxidase
VKDPIQILDGWLREAGAADELVPGAMTLVTVSPGGQPSARIVSLKRLESDGLVFTTGLWTRKAGELRANPRVAAVFHWPSLGRQVRVEGHAEVVERELAEELFAARPRDRQLQALVSRQGETIDDIAPLRARLEVQESVLGEDPIPCPDDWGAVRVRPDAVEFWEEAADRLHDRLLYERDAGGWSFSRLAP